MERAADTNPRSSVESNERLERDGFVRHVEGRLRTTRRWQGAMARAATRLVGSAESNEDLRVPIAMALFEAYGGTLSDDELARLVDAMFPIEVHELAPSLAAPSDARPR